MFLASSVERRGRVLLALLFALLLSMTALAARTQQEPAPQSQQPTPSPAPQSTPTPPPSLEPTTTPAPAPTPSPSPAEVEEVERIDTDLTNVLLSATDKKRRFVTMLRPEDLRLTEDGVVQKIDSFERQTDAPLSLALLVDLSSSQAAVLPAERDAARAFVASVLKPRDQASVITFTGLTRLDQPPTNDAARLQTVIDSLKPQFSEDSPECDEDDPNVPEDVRIRCYTAVWDSIAIAIREVLARTPERTRRAVILLSDGDDTKSQLRVYQAADFAVRNNTVVYAVGIRDPHAHTGSMRRDYLEQITESTGGRAFFPKRPADLASDFAEIEQELRSQYLITYTSTNRARDASFRKVQIEVINPALRKQNLRLMYRQGYYAKGSGQ